MRGKKNRILKWLIQERKCEDWEGKRNVECIVFWGHIWSNDQRPGFDKYGNKWLFSNRPTSQSAVVDIKILGLCLRTTLRVLQRPLGEFLEQEEAL